MRLFGHPVHPLMVHFPISFWALATAFDGFAIIGLDNFLGFDTSWHFASMIMALGLIFALPAMVTGLIDLASLPSTAERTGNTHMLVMCGAWTCYLISFITRLDGAALSVLPQLLPVVFSFIGLILVGIGGWFGGQLVYKHGAGRHIDDASD